MAPSFAAHSTQVLQPRAYQLEMLEDSMQRNIVVAMDTGSGKTQVAILRMAAELERCKPHKKVWFLCPTVALVEQQHSVVSIQLPSYQSLILSGSDGVDKWSTAQIWEDVLLNVHIVVCTPQVLYDALVHGFVLMKDIALLVFDEAHHCHANHVMNRIMQVFYHPLKDNSAAEIPYILGLTASPRINAKQGSLE